MSLSYNYLILDMDIVQSYIIQYNNSLAFLLEIFIDMKVQQVCLLYM